MRAMYSIEAGLPRLPGPTGLLFRDQSEEVIRKATRSSRAPRKQRKPPSRPNSLEAHIASKAIISSDKTVQSLGDFPLVLEPSLDPGQDEAICFFLNRFAWQASSLHFNTWREGSSMGSNVLKCGISSVGLAMLSLLRKSSSLRLSARNAYASALQLTNAALSDRIEATSDTTLAAIILLSLFDVRQILSCCVLILRLTHYRRLSPGSARQPKTGGLVMSTAPPHS